MTQRLRALRDQRRREHLLWLVRRARERPGVHVYGADRDRLARRLAGVR